MIKAGPAPSLSLQTMQSLTGSGTGLVVTGRAEEPRMGSGGHLEILIFPGDPHPTLRAGKVGAAWNLV